MNLQHDIPTRNIRGRRARISAVDPDNPHNVWVAFRGERGAPEPAWWPGNTALTVGKDVRVTAEPELKRWEVHANFDSAPVEVTLYGLRLMVSSFGLILGESSFPSQINVSAGAVDTELFSEDTSFMSTLLGSGWLTVPTLTDSTYRIVTAITLTHPDLSFKARLERVNGSGVFQELITEYTFSGLGVHETTVVASPVFAIGDRLKYRFYASNAGGSTRTVEFDHPKSYIDTPHKPYMEDIIHYWASVGGSSQNIYQTCEPFKIGAFVYVMLFEGLNLYVYRASNPTPDPTLSGDFVDEWEYVAHVGIPHVAQEIASRTLQIVDDVAHIFRILKSATYYDGGSNRMNYFTEIAFDPADNSITLMPIDQWLHDPVRSWPASSQMPDKTLVVIYPMDDASPGTAGDVVAVATRRPFENFWGRLLIGEDMNISGYPTLIRGGPSPSWDPDQQYIWVVYKTSYGFSPEHYVTANNFIDYPDLDEGFQADMQDTTVVNDAYQLIEDSALIATATHLNFIALQASDLRITLLSFEIDDSFTNTTQLITAVNARQAVLLQKDDGTLALIWGRDSDKAIYYTPAPWTTPVQILLGHATTYFNISPVGHYHNDADDEVFAYFAQCRSGLPKRSNPAENSTHAYLYQEHVV